ncbi:MAG: hypothetical protein PHR07_08055 [Acidaminococcaceae bacterium]|nr:hypothetical protein [Acidaminococcaceae bacterium]
MARILWLSRHLPTKAQVNDLESIYKDSVVIVQYNITVYDAKHIIKLMQKENCSDVLVVLPLFILEDLVNKGVSPIISVMDKRKGGHSKFIRLRKIKLECDTLTGGSHDGN